MIDGLIEHVELFLGDIAGTWDADPDGNELPFQIAHFDPSRSPAGTEIYSTLGLSDFELGEHQARVELLMIVPRSLTAGSIPPILHDAGVMPIDADRSPQLGDTYRAVDGLAEVSPMDSLYVGRPLYQPSEFSPFDNGDVRVVFYWLIPVYEAEAELIEVEGWREFEELLWDFDADPTDLLRDPLVD